MKRSKQKKHKLGGSPPAISFNKYLSEMRLVYCHKYIPPYSQLLSINDIEIISIWKSDDKFIANTINFGMMQMHSDLLQNLLEIIDLSKQLTIKGEKINE